MHKTWKKYQGVFKHCVSLKKGYLFSACYYRLCNFSVTESLLSIHCLMHTTIQCISINVRSCVSSRPVWPLIFIQLNSTLPNHCLLQNCGSSCVKSHWLHLTTSPGMCNIAFHFPSRVCKAWAPINSDILQWCVGLVCISSRLSHFHCLICIHCTTVDTIKGLSHVRQISIWIHTTVNIIYASVGR